MINLSTSEGKAYDELAILEVKASRGGQPDFDAFSVREEEMARLVGTHYDVLRSQEYSDLLQTNLELFKLIDFIKDPARPEGDHCRENEIDMLNHKRFLCKAALQERFFPGSSLGERKLGYDKQVS